jgi:hypothetical protein
MGDRDLKLRTKEYALEIIRLFPNYLKEPRSRSWKAIVPLGHVSRSAIPRGNAGQIDRGLQQSRGIAIGAGRKRILAGITRRVRILPAGKTAWAKERNRRVEGDIRQHRKKHQSQFENSETLAFVFAFSKLILYPFAFILLREAWLFACFRFQL